MCKKHLVIQMSLQRTLAIVKPNMLTLLKDGSLQRYSIEQSMAICSKFATENNFKGTQNACARSSTFATLTLFRAFVAVIDSKTVHLSRLQAEAFYNEHRGKFFYPRLVSYMSSGTLGVLILEAPNAVQRWRSLIVRNNC